ncbi:IS861 transposase [Streptococcus equi subsp. zooepidemicus ATCC 35246]|nr:IS861 transposase [Streptococcus equi subsp. zooepidemicus ATCC 35246]AIA68897.1 hypothetical protein Q426_07935 [Streptococcus equi subsp. zooepidemicus CY]
MLMSYSLFYIYCSIFLWFIRATAKKEMKMVILFLIKQEGDQAREDINQRTSGELEQLQGE